MKYYLKNRIAIFFLFITTFVNGQVGINTTTPHASSVLELFSTTQGFLMTRVTTAQRNTIATPANGLIVYNTDTNSFNYFNGSAWLPISSSVVPIIAKDAIELTPNSFIATWDKTNTTTYYLDVSTSADFSTFLAGYNNLNVGNVNNYNVTGLASCGVPYYYRIKYINNFGVTVSSNIITVYPPCCTSTYSVSPIPFSPIALSSSNSVYLFDDDMSVALPVGFNFYFYCKKYDYFKISSNGFLSFGGNPYINLIQNFGLLPDTTEPNNFISAGMDLNPIDAPGKVSFKTIGVAPFRKLVVQFLDVTNLTFGTPPDVSFQIILYETTNVIEVHGSKFLNVTAGVIGIENEDGTSGVHAPGRNNNFYNTTNEAWRFN